MKENVKARRVAVWKAAAACIDLLKTRFGVRRASVFGSLAGHSPWHARSDIDIAVEGLAAVRVDRDLPVGPHRHTYLLQRVMNPWMDVRPAVIDRELAARLADYMRFCHLFRHTDGFELEWAKCRPLVEGMRPTFQSLRARLSEFPEQLEAGKGDPEGATP